jgi:hypothetical protein
MTGPIAKFEDRTLIEMSVAGHSESFSVLMERAMEQRLGGASER